MATIEKSKMLNGRVGEQSAEKAARILAANGLTVSSFIRNSINFIAVEGVVPPSGFAPTRESVDAIHLRDVVRKIESRPMPGRQDYPDLEGDELVERLRMERYGY